MTVASEFLAFSADKLAQLLGRIEICAGELTPEQVWARGSESENAVGNLLIHLNGNLRQWMLHGVGGYPDQRDRDSEFAARDETIDGAAAAELLDRLRATVEEVAGLIRSLPAARLLERRAIQGYEVTVLSAIYHVVEHFSGHAFQIFLLTKQFTGQDLGFYAHLSSKTARLSPQP